MSRTRFADYLFGDIPPRIVAAMTAHLTASPALAKICARAGILPEMPLRVRAPYLAGTEDDVVRLRRLIEAKYPELAYRP